MLLIGGRLSWAQGKPLTIPGSLSSAEMHSDRHTEAHRL